MEAREIDNTIYDTYGDRWYTAWDDPVALLRSETRAKLPWILARLPAGAEVLDVGCGGGFVSNALSAAGFAVTGLDCSADSLRVAERWDATRRARYVHGDAYALPFPDASFGAVTAMDMLEHVEEPGRVIAECARVLRPGGFFFFSTLNRGFLSWLVGIQLVTWLVKNARPNMHVHRLFLKPGEVGEHCLNCGLGVRELTGVRPRFSTVPLRSYVTGVVPESMEFALTPSLGLLYMGLAEKS